MSGNHPNPRTAWAGAPEPVLGGGYFQHEIGFHFVFFLLFNGLKGPGMHLLSQIFLFGYKSSPKKSLLKE